MGGLQCLESSKKLASSPESHPLMAGDLHTLGIDVVCRELNLDDREKGLSNDAWDREEKNMGDNFIPPPLPCPAWLCCLLPCLKNTPDMRLHREDVPGDAWKLMSGNETLIASEGLVRGDVVILDVNNTDATLGKCVVPADIMLFEVEGGFEMYRSVLDPSQQRVKGTTES